MIINNLSKKYGEKMRSKILLTQEQYYLLLLLDSYSHSIRLDLGIDKFAQSLNINEIFLHRILWELISLEFILIKVNKNKTISFRVSKDPEKCPYIEMYLRVFIYEYKSFEQYDHECEFAIRMSKREFNKLLKTNLFDTELSLILEKRLEVEHKIARAEFEKKCPEFKENNDKINEYLANKNKSNVSNECIKLH